MTEFDPDWPHGHMTSDGRYTARFMCRINNSKFPFVFILRSNDTGDEWPKAFTENGRQYLSTTSSEDLINAPAPKRKWKVWVRTIETSDGSIDHAFLSCRPTASDKVLAIKEIEITEGEGLDADV